jgi:hypothetical protein
LFIFLMQLSSNTRTIFSFIISENGRQINHED